MENGYRKMNGVEKKFLRQQLRGRPFFWPELFFFFVFVGIAIFFRTLQGFYFSTEVPFYLVPAGLLVSLAWQNFSSKGFSRQKIQQLRQDLERGSIQIFKIQVARSYRICEVEENWDLVLLEDTEGRWHLFTGFVRPDWIQNRKVPRKINFEIAPDSLEIFYITYESKECVELKNLQRRLPFLLVHNSKLMELGYAQLSQKDAKDYFPEFFNS